MKSRNNHLRTSLLGAALFAIAACAQAQITISGGNVSVQGEYGNTSIVDGVVSTVSPAGRITAGKGAVSVGGANGVTNINNGTIQQSGQKSSGYRRQGDLTINDVQNGQAAIATGSNQTVINKAGNMAENRAGNYRQGNPGSNPSQPSSPTGDAFWGKGGFWGDKE